MNRLATCVFVYLQLNFIITGLQPLKRLLVITFLVRLLHLIWLCSVVFLMFYRRVLGGDTSVGGLVGTASFVCNGTVNIVIILESKFKERQFWRILSLKREIDRLIEKKLNIKVRPNVSYNHMMLRFLSILGIQFVCEGLKIYINAISKVHPVFWYSFPITVSLRTRYIQIIAIIMTLNGRLEIFKEALIVSAKNNEPKSLYASEVWQPYTEEEYDKVNHMRLIYLRIWEMYKAVNDCFSWSLLFLFMTSFLDIVCNCFWTFAAIYKGQSYHKYVFNGATSMSLASLVIMLFYYTDMSESNLSPTYTASNMNQLATCVFIFLHLNFIICGLQPLKRLSVITFLVRLIHLFWLCSVVFLMFYRRVLGGDTSVSGLVGTGSFVCNGTVNIIIILESKFKEKQFGRIFKLEQEIDRLVEKKLSIKVRPNINYNRMMLRMLWLLCIQFACDGLKISINTLSVVNPVFWYSAPITISLRARYIQIIYIIMKLNGRVEIFKEALIISAKNNEPKSLYASEVWKPYTEEEYDKVNHMRLIYLRIWETYKAVNDCFSWSMLFLFMTSFLDIVCNCFWTFAAIYKAESFHKYVFNGATSTSLSSLVIMLFYYTDMSESNTLKQIFLRSESTTFNIAIFCAHLALWIFALTPFTSIYLIYQLYILLWCGELFATCYMAVAFDIIADENSLNGLVGTLLFIVHAGGHFVILVNSWMMRGYRRSMYVKFFQLKEALQRNMLIPYSERKMAKKLLMILILFGCLVFIGHGLIIWTTFESKSTATSLYWRSLPSVLALQFKSLEFLLAMVQVNDCVAVMRQNINEIGERNLRKVFNAVNVINLKHKVKFINVLPQRDDQEDEKQVEILKGVYNDIYAMFQLLNGAYGLSLLAIMAVYFVVFVCNTYWILLSVISQGRDYYTLLQNACFALSGFILLALLCWMSEQALNESHYIGCLISKLVKPLGNQRYNDLVGFFSVQTLHQRFIITAKEFFILNLGLLGSMVAAIVTYLVILIQFMFTEKSNNEGKLSTKMPMDDTLVTSTMAGNLAAIDTLMVSSTSRTIGDKFNSTVG